MALVRYQPRRLLNEFDFGFNSLLDEFYGRNRSLTEDDECTWTPSVDVIEHTDSFEIIADLPGLTRSDINITVRDGNLELSGEKTSRKEEKGKNFHRIERCAGKFKRVFTLPETVDPEKIEATYKEGVLNLRLVKSEKALPKQIDIKIK